MSNNKSFEVFIPYATSQVNADILKILSSSMSKKRTLADRNNSLEIVVSGKYDLLDPEYLDAPDEYYIEDFDKVYSYHYLTFENRREFSSKSVILPIIKLSDEAFEEIIGNIPRGVDEIELGYYPGTAVSIYNFKFFSEYVFKNRIAYIKNKKFTAESAFKIKPNSSSVSRIAFAKISASNPLSAAHIAVYSSAFKSACIGSLKLIFFEYSEIFSLYKFKSAKRLLNSLHFIKMPLPLFRSKKMRFSKNHSPALWSTASSCVRLM